MGYFFRNTLSIASFVLMGWVAVALNQRYSDISPQNTFKVDVCVVGGGAAGTYAAIKTLDVNKMVVVVEQQYRLGGHTKTYIDPVSEKTNRAWGRRV